MLGYILEPFSDPIAVTFALVIGLMFLFSLLRSMSSPEGLSPFNRYAPTALTTIGVLGTFTGIYVGLMEFDVADIDGSIPALLSGMKIAFSTSIMGMMASVVLKLMQGTRRQKSGKETVTAGDIYQVMSEVRDETKNNREQSAELLLEVKGAISGDGDSSLVTQIQKLRTSTQDGLQETKQATKDGLSTLAEEFRTFAETMAENNSNALIEALQEVIRDFNEKLTEQFGENFKQLNEAVGALLVWQENYKSQVETMVTEFDVVKEGITDVRDAVAVIGLKTQEIPKTMDELSKVVKLADNQIEELQAHLEAIADLRDKAVTAFPIIEDNIVKLTTDFSSAVKDNTALVSEMMDEQSSAIQDATSNSISMLDKSTVKHQEALANIEVGMTEIPKQVDSLLGQLQDDLGDVIGTFNTEMETGVKEQSTAIKETIGGLRDSLQQSLTDTNDVIQQSFEVFDEQMQEEIQRTIETMGGHLASLSNKFVEDYSPLTDKLSRVLEISKRAGE